MSTEVDLGPDTLERGESLFAPTPKAPLGGALWTSIGLHAGLVAAALMTLGAAPPIDDSTRTEAIFVELVSSDAFSSDATATTESSASVAMLAAGATLPELKAPPVEEPAPEPEPEPVVEPQPEVPEPAPEPAAPESPPVEADSPAAAPAWQAAPLLAVAAVDSEPSFAVAEAPTSDPPPEPAAPSQPPGKAPPKLDPEPANPVEKPVETPKAPAKPKAKVADAEKPKEKPKDKKPAEKPREASAGKGGKNEADAAAAKASAGKSGKSDDGAAAVSKYPGLVQKALRRALRFPKGAGRAGGEAQVQFTVSASGSVSGISVVRSTGNPVLDAEAVKTVQRAAPFPPIPADAGRRTWTFTMPLLFKR
jgi:periplasmic protein TonB